MPGTAAALRFTKYDGSPHWRYDLLVLGADAYGVWLGGWPGDLCAQPGRVIDPGVHWTTLIPHVGDWVATLNEPGGPLTAAFYVDVTDRPRWSRGARGWTLRAVDLDLDVVRRFTGEISIDDEDEFEENQHRWSYPGDLVARSRATAHEIHAAMLAGREPFGEVGPAWLARARSVTRAELAAEAARAGGAARREPPGRPDATT